MFEVLLLVAHSGEHAVQRTASILAPRSCRLPCPNRLSSADAAAEALKLSRQAWKRSKAACSASLGCIITRGAGLSHAEQAGALDSCKARRRAADGRHLFACCLHERPERDQKDSPSII